MEKSEILVHVSAPSGVRDDARYRAQVEAILGFQSVSCQNINITLQPSETVEDDSNNPDGPSRLPELVTVLPSDQGNNDNNTTTSGDEQESVIATAPLSPSQDKGKIPQNNERLQLPLVTADHQTEHITLQDNEASLGPLGISQSIGLAAAVAAPDRTAPSPLNPALSEKHQSRARLEKDSLDSPVSVIPDSQPEHLAPEPEGDLHLQEIPQPSKCQFVTGSSSSAKRRRVDSPLSSQIIPPASTSTDDASPYISLASLPLQIHPPLPPVSNAHFVTHITPTLTMLTERLNPSRTYKPIKKTRDLDILERGHWFLRINILEPHVSDVHTNTANNPPNQQPQTTNPNTWTLPTFHRFWRFLSDFISKESRAGWGVWCLLDEEEQADDAHALTPQPADPTTFPTREDHEEKKPPPHPSRPLVFKIYAWGEIAMHIYLLLFLASERRVRKMGAQWWDGSQEVVIQM